jgi:hypothetical protein
MYSSIKDKVHIVILKKNVTKQINIVIPLGAMFGKNTLKKIDESKIIIDTNPKNRKTIPKKRIDLFIVNIRPFMACEYKSKKEFFDFPFFLASLS